MKVLITSGGTTEPIDNVRGISNFATGSLGKVTAENFLNAGHEVYLLAGLQAKLPEFTDRLTYIPIEGTHDLYEQMKNLKGNVVSILTSLFVGSLTGIISVILICKAMGASDILIASIQPKSVTTPIAIEIAEKTGGIPSLTAVIVVAVGIFGSMAGPFILKKLGVENRIAKGLALGASAHGIGTSVAIQIGAIEGAISGLAIGIMGIMTAILVPLVQVLLTLF